MPTCGRQFRSEGRIEVRQSIRTVKGEEGGGGVER